MHKGDYHTDYSKYYNKEYKDKDVAFEHIKDMKSKQRKDDVVKQSILKETNMSSDRLVLKKRIVKKSFDTMDGKDKK